VLSVFHIKKDETAVSAAIGTASRMGLRMCMTIIPIAVLIIGLIVFKKNYILTDEKMEDITKELNRA
jgi:melibiose permease